MRYRYSRWTGLEQTEGIQPEEMIDSLVDTLLADGDVGSVLRQAQREGLQLGSERRLPGWSELLDAIGSARDAVLSEHDLLQVLREIEAQVGSSGNRGPSEQKESVELHRSGPSRAVPSLDGEDGGIGDVVTQVEQMVALLSRASQDVGGSTRHSRANPDGNCSPSEPGDFLGSFHSVPVSESAHDVPDAISREPLSLAAALAQLRRVCELDELDSSIRQAIRGEGSSRIDWLEVKRLLGEDMAVRGQSLSELPRWLEEAGYLERREGILRLTTPAARRLGEKALQDIFQVMRRDLPGEHQGRTAGAGTQRSEGTRSYTFGDTMEIDVHGTLMNAVRRRGPGPPLSVAADDFEVYSTEEARRSSAVLVLDLSRSMPRRGCFVAAKKVAIALDTLIRTRFPRDDLAVVGFSHVARDIAPGEIHLASWRDYAHGTNMQHALSMARRRLGRHRTGNRQIILITDGEPTAHFEEERLRVTYPTSASTVEETLREVRRCSQEGIIINTFMLARGHGLIDFVSRIVELNHGRAFFTTPERLGEYVLLDYMRSRA